VVTWRIAKTVLHVLAGGVSAAWVKTKHEACWLPLALPCFARRHMLDTVSHGRTCRRLEKTAGKSHLYLGAQYTSWEEEAVPHYRPHLKKEGKKRSKHVHRACELLADRGSNDRTQQKEGSLRRGMPYSILLGAAVATFRNTLAAATPTYPPPRHITLRWL